MTLIQNPHELAAVRKLPRAILQVWVAWSGSARQSEGVVRRFLTQWEAAQGQSLPAFVVDVSDQAGELWDAMSEWLRQEQETDAILYSGAGSLLWLCQGVIAAKVHNPAHDGVEALVRNTERVFQ